jgi:hypothetical protein
MSEKWHVSKAISLSHIATTGILILSAIIYITGIEKEVAKHTVQIEAMSERVSFIDNSHNALFSKIDGRLEKIFDLLYQMKNE